jgi:AraC-like DNA-binding protein
VLGNFREFEGRELPWEIDDSMIAVFDNAGQAVLCAKTIQEEFLKNEDKIPRIIYKMGIGAGQPVTLNGDFFSTTLRLSHRLSNAADDNQILLSSLTGKLAKLGPASDPELLRVVSPSEELLLTNLFNAIESHLSDDQLNIEGLCRSIGISRPQLYRKVRSITGRSPSYFLRDLRLDKARTLLHQKSGNVTEVAYEVGYTNLSYFSKCFTEKFGYKPSAV